MAEPKEKWSRLSMLPMPEGVDGNKSTVYATYNDKKGREVVAREAKGVDTDTALRAAKQLNMEKPKGEMARGGMVKKMAKGGLIRGTGAATKGKRFNNGVC